jgi:hypothetical protein
MDDLPKQIKRQLRELNSKAYQVELSNKLEKLWTQFTDWKAGKIGPWELTEAIHKYHNSTARDLYNLYETSVNLRLNIGRAVALGLLTRDDIPASVWPHVESVVEYYRQEFENNRKAKPDHQ